MQQALAQVLCKGSAEGRIHAGTALANLVSQADCNRKHVGCMPDALAALISLCEAEGEREQAAATRALLGLSSNRSAVCKSLDSMLLIITLFLPCHQTSVCYTQCLQSVPVFAVPEHFFPHFYLYFLADAYFLHVLADADDRLQKEPSACLQSCVGRKLTPRMIVGLTQACQGCSMGIHANA